ncbi:MAG TPA: glycosyltransferase family 39 protein [Candidatus Sumerlaeota bacterium]|nr:glycosyltransferase family 39 protein [Candidatus Sumerlaeota bacterium]
MRYKIPYTHRWLLLFSMLVFIGLGSLKLGATSLWLDEIMSLDFCDGSWREMYFGLRNDVHAPFFYIMLRLFIKLLGISEWTGRLPALMAGAATLPALYFLTIELNPKKPATLAILILACSPMFLEFSREVHPYSLSAFFSVCSWLFFLRLIKHPKKSSAVCYALSTGFLLLTFYLGIIVVIAQFLFLLFFRFSNRKKRLIFYAWIGGACVFSIWLPIFIAQATENKISPVVGGYFVGGIRARDFIRLITDIFWGTGARELNYMLLASGVFVVLFFPLILLMGQKHISGSSRYIPFWIFWMPILIFTLLSFVKPLYLSRYCTMLVPFAALLLGSALEAIHHKAKWAVLILIIAASLFSYNIYLKNLPREDWRGVGQYLISQMKSEDVVVADNMTAASCAVYYFKILQRLEYNKNVFPFVLFYNNTNGKYLFSDRTLWYIKRPKPECEKQLQIIRKENIFLKQINFKSGFTLYSFAGGK